MTGPYRHFGWLTSPYSAKTRSYLRFKGIDFEDHAPTAIELFGRIRKAVGRPVMPTVQTADGRWLQDTSEIIDTLERAHPDRAVIPSTPRQRVAALLLEVHGDEWLPILAIHYRWNVPENGRFAVREFARDGLPWIPDPLARRLIRPVARKMASYRRVLGVGEDTRAGIERFARELIGHLDAHFAGVPFLFGSRPSIGDFALFGPLWAHMYRDPGTTGLFDEAPALREWFERMLRPDGEPGAFAPDDAIPKSLVPIFATLFEEHWAFARATFERIDAWCTENPGAQRVPRSLGNHPFTIGGAAGTRRLLTFSAWMAQRPLEAYRALDDSGRERVRAWLGGLGHPDALELTIRHPQERVDFQMRLREPPR